MPTYEWLDSFERDLGRLSPDQRRAFLAAVEKFVVDLRGGRGFRSSLRVKGIRGARGIFELTWADDGRATFSFGKSLRDDEPHVIWRRIGTHEIFDRP